MKKLEHSSSGVTPRKLGREGLTFVEVMIATSVSVVFILALGQMGANSTTFARKIQNDLDIQVLNNRIQTQFMMPDSCRLAFHVPPPEGFTPIVLGPAPLAANTEVSDLKILDSDGNVLIEKDMKVAANVVVSKVSLKVLSSTTPPESSCAAPCPRLRHQAVFEVGLKPEFEQQAITTTSGIGSEIRKSIGMVFESETVDGNQVIANCFIAQPGVPPDVHGSRTFELGASGMTAIAPLPSGNQLQTGVFVVPKGVTKIEVEMFGAGGGGGFGYDPADDLTTRPSAGNRVTPLRCGGLCTWVRGNHYYPEDGVAGGTQLAGIHPMSTPLPAPVGIPTPLPTQDVPLTVDYWPPRAVDFVYNVHSTFRRDYWGEGGGSGGYERFTLEVKPGYQCTVRVGEGGRGAKAIATAPYDIAENRGVNGADSLLSCVDENNLPVLISGQTVKRVKGGGGGASQLIYDSAANRFYCRGEAADRPGTILGASSTKGTTLGIGAVGEAPAGDLGFGSPLDAIQQNAQNSWATPEMWSYGGMGANGPMNSGIGGVAGWQAFKKWSNDWSLFSSYSSQLCTGKWDAAFYGGKYRYVFIGYPWAEDSWRNAKGKRNALVSECNLRAPHAKGGNGSGYAAGGGGGWCLTAGGKGAPGKVVIRW